MLARFRVIIGSAFLLLFGAGILFLVGPWTFGSAGEFDQLMDEAVERGTQVDAARSRRDAAEAGVRKAWSRFLPSVNAYGEFGYNRDNALGRLNGIDRNHHDNSSYGIKASMPIFHGGENYYGLKGAEASAVAEQHSFHEARQLLLLNTARAILGIIRDREIVNLQRDNQNIVTSILRSTEARFRGGEATRTDIAIAKDQLTASQSVYTQAIDNLRSNETEFHRLIGRAPGRLALPRNLASRLPKSLDEAVSLAEQQNPQLLAAIFRSEAADHSLKASYGKFLPKVDLNMDYSEDRYHDGPLNDESDFSVKLNFSIPLFQPDALPARDESMHVSDQRRFEARDARFTAKAMATVAWRSYHTAQKKYHLSLTRIRAAKAASRGMQRELEAGQRNVLDVLDTQERLVEARVSAANAKYERYMAAHLLLSAIGQLDASSYVVEDFKGYVKSAEKARKKGDSGWKAAKLEGAALTTASIKQRSASKGRKDGVVSWRPEVSLAQNAKPQNYKAKKVKAQKARVITTLPQTNTPPVLPVRKPSAASKLALAKLPVSSKDESLSDSKIAITDIAPVIKRTVLTRPKLKSVVVKKPVVKAVELPSVKIASVEKPAGGSKIAIAEASKFKAVKTETPLLKPLKAKVVKAKSIKTETQKSQSLKIRTSKKAVLSKDLHGTSLKSNPIKSNPKKSMPLKYEAETASIRAEKTVAKEQPVQISCQLPVSEGTSGGVMAYDLREDKTSGAAQYAAFAKPPLPVIKKIYSGLVTRYEAYRSGAKQPAAAVALQKKKRAISSEDGIVTGSVERRHGYALARVQPFHVHKIPLPKRKAGLVTRKVTSRGPITTLRSKREKSVISQAGVRSKPLTKAAVKPDIEEYPDTYNNRFSMWWNKQVDKVVGAPAGPKRVLVPLDEYRKKHH
ncbi:MAG: hypothetical protein DHS20C08_25070 [Rhodomicrobium sp.]|nr:MAG: hypothetical protein DHS20C08_25070 [Rhodomicrobium sp.]